MFGWNAEPINTVEPVEMPLELALTNQSRTLLFTISPIATQSKRSLGEFAFERARGKRAEGPFTRSFGSQRVAKRGSLGLPRAFG